MGIAADAKAGVNAAKSHWLFFLILTFLLVGLAFRFDSKNGGKIRAWFAGLPVVGNLFAGG